MQLYRIEKITVKPLLVLAHSHEDARNIFAHALVTGMSNLPDADFDIVIWPPKATGAPYVIRKWRNANYRGIVWNVEDGRGWELVSTRLIDPEGA